MNHAVTTRDAILEKCRQMVTTRGWSSISIRAVASSCDVSVGAIYNYFASKAELVLATVESVFEDVFRMPFEGSFESVTACIRWAYACMASGAQRYPGFFVSHAALFSDEDKVSGRSLMDHVWKHMHAHLLLAIECDPHIRQDAFDEHLSPQGLADLIFSQLVMDLMRGMKSPDTLLTLIERSLY